MDKKHLKQLKHNIGMLRQWLNEDRITDYNKLVTNEELEFWLIYDGLKNKKDKSQKLNFKVTGWKIKLPYRVILFRWLIKWVIDNSRIDIDVDVTILGTASNDEIFKTKNA